MLIRINFSDIDGNALDAQFGSGSTDDGGDDGGDCTQDCEGINDVDNEDVDSVCDWFSSLGGSSNECFSDCSEEEMEFPTMIDSICSCYALTESECVDSTDCAFGAWGEDVGCWPNFVFEDEDGGDDGDDGGDSYCPDGTQVCLSLDGGDLNYSSTEDIAGFQFSHNGCVSGASGGDAETNGFTISASGSTVLGFSFTGSVVPAGDGTLVILDGEVNENCLTNLIFSDSDGEPLSSQFSVESVLGCTDELACNYDMDANNDDGSCVYPEENFDCYGNCTVVDCFGECGGDAVEDCSGQCGGSAVEDACGVCDGDGSTCDYGCLEGVEVCLSLDGSNLNYSSTVDIAGFQFNHNGCVEGAGGGDAEANGFTVSSSGAAVLGFSFTGSVIPAGSGTIVVLDGM